MEIYLIRHTKPDVAKGVCYGQTDLDVADSFAAEAAAIRQYLPADGIAEVHSSPLRRCSQLAQHLFPAHPIAFHDHLMEINCGEWEMQRWDDIPAAELQPWMDDFVQVTIPGGESYTDLYQRVTERFAYVLAGGRNAAIVAHGGVIRSILAYITGTALVDSFTIFTLHYGCVVRITGEAGNLVHEVLHNVATEAETHKPSQY